jgi:hypothetical protein
MTGRERLVAVALAAAMTEMSVAGTAIAADAGAAPPAEAPRRIGIGGFVDLVYAYNCNRPADHANWFDGVGTAAKRDDELSINLAQIDFVLAPKPVGFHLAGGYGTALEVVHSGEIEGVATGQEAWGHLVQASIQYDTAIGRGLSFEAGVYPSHVGFETLATKDNWNYTRSWLGELSPYYQTGVKIATPLGGRWSAQVHLLNGWQRISDNNRGKTLGWQFARKGDRIALTLNGLVGPELTDDDRDLRGLLDTVVVVTATPAWSLAASLDLAAEEQPEGGRAGWGGLGVFARRAAPGARTAVAMRAEYYDDGEGAISGTAQILREYTGTFEFRPVDALILRLEARYDHSSAEAFAGDEVDAEGDAVRDPRDQVLFVAGAVAVF